LPNIVTTGGTGFGLLAYPIAVERGWITRPQAVQRLVKIVSFLQRVERFHGMWAHWYDGCTGQVRPFSSKDDGGDLVESAFLLQGLLTVREYFQGEDELERQLRQQITVLWHQAEWDWYTQGQPWLYWHWSPRHAFAMNMRVMGLDETMIAYVLAIASPTHPIDPSLYDSGWAIERNERFPDRGDYIQRLRIGHGRSGGPLFFTQYSHLGLTPYLKDRYVTAAGYRDYAEHHRAMALYNHQWCRRQGYPAGCWGLSSSDDPELGYRSHQPEDGGDNGTITPSAAISSIVYTPQESMAFLRYLWDQQRATMWTDFGFRAAFNLEHDWYAPAHLAIDQGPTVVMIENYRTGKPWRWFMRNREITGALEKMGLQLTQAP
jgi:hypothetical protein